MTTHTPSTIVWFRRDLRVSDHAALVEAVRLGPVVPVFILASGEEGDWEPGAASRWWLHHSLQALGDQLTSLGAPLVLRRGSSLPCLLELAREAGANRVFWHRLYEPAGVARDGLVREGLRQVGIEARDFAGHLLFEPGSVRSGAGRPYQVFTPFWKACQGVPQPAGSVEAPARLIPSTRRPKSLRLDELGLLPKTDWAGGLRAAWQPGAHGALARLTRFTDDVMEHYATDRDRPAWEGTSRLSPHLHFGEVSVREAWQTIMKAGAQPESNLTPRGGRSSSRVGLAIAAKQSLEFGRDALLRQLIWREFSHHLLVDFPRTAAEPLRSEFAAFAWRRDARALEAWQKGRTGYPLVDAGMRELWQTGWMHNRVRMVVASFLVKHLLLPWQEGARWFWDALVDADLANNSFGWQWAAGCGADAAPYFRIFNPTAQGIKFDPQGEYIYRWVPELKNLTPSQVHHPWEASSETLATAKIRLGREYPAPIVEHAGARKRALAAFADLRARPPKEGIN